jgi:hypothetical protein
VGSQIKTQRRNGRLKNGLDMAGTHIRVQDMSKPTIQSAISALSFDLRTHILYIDGKISPTSSRWLFQIFSRKFLIAELQSSWHNGLKEISQNRF